METPEPRPWYKKKRYLLPLGLVALVALGGDGSPPPPHAQTPQAAALETQRPSQETGDTPANLDSASPVSSRSTQAEQSVPDQGTPQSQQSSLSNDNYYTNVDGNQVHSPAYSNTVPTGATAQCRDGTYSFSQHRSGTCSHHGGVASWL